MPKFDVTIIGAGVAGLSAAIHLQNEGLAVKVLEASDGVGGRVRTDKVDGFLLDRGFQVLHTAYPEALRMLDYDSLRLKSFVPGALIRYQDRNYRFADPFRKPVNAMMGLFSPIGNWGDRLKILALRNRHRRLSLDQIFTAKEMPTLDLLREWNFSESMIESFFRPFLGGVFLDESLQTSSRMFEFVFKMFASGYAALPAEGMGAIPRNLASLLSKGTIDLNTTVASITEKTVLTQSGDKIETEAILIATDAANALKILGRKRNAKKGISEATNGVKCLYFVTDRPPFTQPMLMLNGDGKGLVNNVCVPSVISPTYAPPGRHLISVSVIRPTQLTNEELLVAVKAEMRTWFNKEIRYWEHLKTYDIPKALPTKNSIKLVNKNDIKPVAPGIYVTGDHTWHGSLHGAMESARFTANTISWDLALASNN